MAENENALERSETPTRENGAVDNLGTGAQGGGKGGNEGGGNGGPKGNEGVGEDGIGEGGVGGVSEGGQNQEDAQKAAGVNAQDGAGGQGGEAGVQGGAGGQGGEAAGQDAGNAQGGQGAAGGEAGAGAPALPRGAELERLLAEAEERGYLRGRNERVEALMAEPGMYEQQKAIPRAEEPPTEVMILNNMRRSVWD